MISFNLGAVKTHNDIVLLMHWYLIHATIYILHTCITWYKWFHGDIIKWRHFPRYWPFVRESTSQQWRGALTFSLICASTNGWAYRRRWLETPYVGYSIRRPIYNDWGPIYNNWGLLMKTHYNCGPSYTWWRHQMETFSAILALCAENSPVTGEFPSQRPVTRSFDVFFDLRLNTRMSKHSWGWWFETPSRSLWRHCNDKLGLLK